MNFGLDERLSAAGFRPTRQRRAVYEHLTSLTTHPTAEDVFALVREDLPQISLATVYKALESLASAGLAQKLSCCEGATRYDARVAPHYHARCRLCAQVSDVGADPGLVAALDQIVPPLAVVEQVRLEFHGICERCHAAARGQASSSSSTH